jgi:hypothetical protein
MTIRSHLTYGSSTITAKEGRAACHCQAKTGQSRRMVKKREEKGNEFSWKEYQNIAAFHGVIGS